MRQERENFAYKLDVRGRGALALSVADIHSLRSGGIERSDAFGQNVDVLGRVDFEVAEGVILEQGSHLVQR